MRMKVPRVLVSGVGAIAILAVTGVVLAKSGVLRAHTPVSSPADVRPRPAPGVAPRSTYALNELSRPALKPIFRG